MGNSPKRAKKTEIELLIQKIVQLNATIRRLDVTLTQTQSVIQKSNQESVSKNTIMTYLALSMLFFGIATIILQSMDFLKSYLINASMSDMTVMLGLALCISLYLGLKIAKAAVVMLPKENLIKFQPQSIDEWIVIFFIIIVSLIIVISVIIALFDWGAPLFATVIGFVESNLNG